MVRNFALPGEQSVTIDKGGEWQPIESAPSEEVVLVYRNGEVFSAEVTALLRSHGGGVPHWMPLPAPPSLPA